MSWMAPRGIVAAAVSSVFALALDQADPEFGGSQLVPLTFAVIVGTVTIYGLTASPVARLLGVSDQDPQGVFIVGASPVARSIAGVLKRHGVPVGLIDTNRGNVSAARMAGLNVAYGSVLDEVALEDLDLRGIGRVIAMTPNEEVNTLALQRFAHVFSKAGLYRLAARPEKTKDKSKDKSKERAKDSAGGKSGVMHIPVAKSGQHKTGQKRSASVDMDAGATPSAIGRRLFDTSIDLATLEKRLASGWVIKATSISDEFTADDYHTLYGDEAVPMFVIDPDGDLQIAVAGRKVEAEPGSKLIALVNPESLFILKTPIGEDEA